MADEMNGNDAERIGIQSQRITNLETVFGEFRREFSHQIGAVNTSVTSIQSKMDERFNTLTASLAERNKPQYQALGFALTVILAVGALVYWPIREDTSDLKAAVIETNKVIRDIAATTVSRQEMDWRAARGAEDRLRQDEAIKDLRASMLPRNEWNEKNQSRDHDIDNIREIQTREATNTQRQIDLLRGEFQAFASSLGNGRDFINDMKAEISRLRDQLSEIRARQYQRMGSPPLLP